MLVYLWQFSQTCPTRLTSPTSPPKPPLANYSKSPLPSQQRGRGEAFIRKETKNNRNHQTTPQKYSPITPKIIIHNWSIYPHPTLEKPNTHTTNAKHICLAVPKLNFDRVKHICFRGSKLNFDNHVHKPLTIKQLQIHLFPYIDKTELVYS